MIADTACEALVVATFSRQMTLRLADDSETRARIKGKKIQPVCGDRVVAHPLDDEPEWLITEILPRNNELTRPNNRGRTEVLAANLDFVVVVVSDTPAPDWYIVDRYLAAAELMSVKAMVVFNKTDVATANQKSTLVLQDYQRIGYEVIHCSAETGDNVDRISTALQGKTSIIVGQSGVGKSSLINRLITGASLRVGDLSASSGEGKHTTVNSVLLSLPGTGGVIDSPGVRDYAPVVDSTEYVMHGFPEVSKTGETCRFANCRHLREPNCAVKQAVEDDEISARRYESYRRLLSITSNLVDKKR